MATEAQKLRDESDYLAAIEKLLTCSSIPDDVLIQDTRRLGLLYLKHFGDFSWPEDLQRLQRQFFNLLIEVRPGIALREFYAGLDMGQLRYAVGRAAIVALKYCGDKLPDELFAEAARKEPQAAFQFCPARTIRHDAGSVSAAAAEVGGAPAAPAATNTALN